MAATAKVIELKGNPANPESAEHIIKFPGGSISVCRTSDNQYWAHIEVYTEPVLLDNVRESKNGRIEVIRLDTPNGVKAIEKPDADHFAVLISTGEPFKKEEKNRVQLELFV